MCAFQNSQTWRRTYRLLYFFAVVPRKELDGVARVEGKKLLSIEGKARAEGETRDKAEKRSGES